MSADIVVAAGKALPASYGKMVDRIRERMPAVARDSAAFHKSHSQFMQVTVDLTMLTPLRSIKHTLAEIARTRQALEEAHIAQRRNDLARRQLQAALSGRAIDLFAREKFEIDLQEIDLKSANIADAVAGAVRKLSNLVAQHEALLKKIGKDSITEADYEADEARYHIMTAMFQALTAARSRGGVIDEGNFLYIFQLGISPSEAQSEVLALLTREAEVAAKGGHLPHAELMTWLATLAERWKDCPRAFAESRGFAILDHLSLASGGEP